RGVKLGWGQGGGTRWSCAPGEGRRFRGAGDAAGALARPRRRAPPSLALRVFAKNYARPVAAPGPGSAAVEDVRAEVLQPEGGVVGPPFRRLAHAGLHHLAHEDRVIAALDALPEPALAEGGRPVEDGRTRRARVEGLARNLLPLHGGGLEEGEGGAALVLSQHI